MSEILLKSLELLRVLGPQWKLAHPPCPPPHLDSKDRQELRQVLEGRVYRELVEARYKEKWLSAMNRLIVADECDLVKRQAEVRAIEEMLLLPWRLLEKPEQE